ncbi:elongation factor G [Thermoactinospora rubra]|uniref:elongation factor G n=1 Tax=Thermoactinospora rubra TaxID=1088767 RepID=UPI000A11E08D|nr:TetM/TetW/TetO/TetS family tetracycline resistance ribosomal protection protein [Thermoactinospora rubra]
MQTLNIGILAHVDAGKTSLTERLLFDTGAITRLGSVDDGSTQTDSGAIERRRGITIRTAVAAFTLGGLQVNLIDTPGHTDFVAEVERALGVLDGAILVLSAVEGVQPHTRVLMRILKRLRLPTLIFVNKADRTGAREAGLLADIRRWLTPYAMPLTTVDGLGTPRARARPVPPDPELLAEHDDDLLQALVEGRAPDPERVRRALAAQCRDAVLHPVLFGSALTGAGVEHLLEAIPLLPAGGGSRKGGTVFAIERTPSGEKVAYVRLHSGTLRPRRPAAFFRGGEEYGARPTAVQVVGSRATTATAGDIAKVWGVPRVRVGDRVGSPPEPGERAHFPPPVLETVVTPRRPGQEGALHAALAALAEQDPFIGTRTLADGRTSVLLYGEVQKEVIAETLARDFGVEADFRPSSPVFLERPAGVGEAVQEIVRHGRNDEWATVGLRVEPGERGSGLTYRLEVELGALPLAFHRAIEESVEPELRSGLRGWPVTDVVVTLTRCGFAAPVSTAGHFRTRTRRVLRWALQAAGTRVYEPFHRFELEIPRDVLSQVATRLAALRADLAETEARPDGWLVRGEIPARRVHEVQRALPGLTHGRGVWWSEPSGDRLRNG